MLYFSFAPAIAFPLSLRRREDVCAFLAGPAASDPLTVPPPFFPSRRAPPSTFVSFHITFPFILTPAICCRGCFDPVAPSGHDILSLLYAPLPCASKYSSFHNFLVRQRYCSADPRCLPLGTNQVYPIPRFLSLFFSLSSFILVDLFLSGATEVSFLRLPDLCMFATGPNRFGSGASLAFFFLQIAAYARSIDSLFPLFQDLYRRVSSGRSSLFSPCFCSLLFLINCCRFLLILSFIRFLASTIYIAQISPIPDGVFLVFLFGPHNITRLARFFRPDDLEVRARRHRSKSLFGICLWVL